MLHRQIMFKQLQAMQQQYLNQYMSPDKQTSGLQNGMPMQVASQMFMRGNTQLTQHGTASNVQGFQNGYVFSQGQNQPAYSMGFSQQPDMSSYGNDMNALSQIQGAFRDPANAMNMGSNGQLEMPLMQQSIAGNSFGNEQLNVADGAFGSKHFGNNNIFGQSFMQAPEPDSAQKNASLMVPTMGQEQGGWPLHTADKATRFEPSHSADSLDPLEAKILFNTDDSSWGSSVCQQSNVDALGYKAEGNLMGPFSSNNSGSWSALMQSAVAEASSSDTGQQEEWSGLTYQNPELSADNDHANFIGNSQSWPDNNLPNISSPPLNTEPHFQHSNMTYSFPSFQETNHQVAMQKEGIQSDFSHGSIQQPQKNVNNWVDFNSSQQKLPGEEGQLVQASPQSHNVWNVRDPQHISSYTIGSQSNNSTKGDGQKENTWQHESGPQHMAEQMQLADQVSSLQVPQLENRSDNLCHEPSDSQGTRVNSNVTSTSHAWYQNNALQFPLNSGSFVANLSPHATFPVARDGVQANATHQQLFGGLEQRDNNSLPNVQNFKALDRYVGPLSRQQNFSLLNQVNANPMQQLFKLHSGVGNVGQGYTNMNSQLSFNSFGGNKPVHSSSGFVGDQSGYTGPQNHTSVQMGPSWFQQYGTVKTGQMLPFADSTLTITAAKQVLDGLSGNLQETDSTGQKDLSNVTNVTARQLLGENEQNLAELRPEKRKRAASELLPWHGEVTESSHTLHELSMAESEWEQASRRLSEKVETETETTWDVDPISRTKKRLVLSTKLMQQVLRPAPAAVLSADASSDFESVVYFAARLSLGDASSLTNSTSEPSDTPSKMPGTSERDGRMNLPKAVENYNIRAQKLEDKFLRLEKTVSVVEIKVEIQELEKYSVINRFAKFHSKAQSAASADASPAPAPAPAAKPVPQRYVVAHPMPNVVPEAGNCLSL